MESFFLDGKAPEDYLFVRDGGSHLCASVRDFIEGAWRRCKPYLDSEVRTDAREHFHQRWWEVYLAHLLLETGVHLVRREDRHPRRSGPDLLARVAGRNLWIEAVAPMGGEGPDAVRSGRLSKGPRPFPEKEIMLRFQQAFSTKVDYHTECANKRWVRENESYVVALNGALAEGGYPCLQQYPRIVSALLLGLEEASVTVEFDETTSRFGETHYEYQPKIEKKLKGTVRLAALHDPANSRVSAVLYSASDAYNCSAMHGVKSSGHEVMAREFALVLNPHAQISLPPDFLSTIPRYWVELHDDRFILHAPPRPAGLSSGRP